MPTPTPSPTPAPVPTPTPPATVTPTAPKTGELLIIKKAEGTGDPLANAVFGVYRVSDDSKVTELTTGADGQVSLTLNPGDYYLKELKAPYGFLAEPSRILFTVTANSSVKVEVTDQRDGKTPDVPQNIDIPKTGEAFPTTNYVFGAALLALALICGVSISKARKKGKSKASGDVAGSEKPKK